MMTPRSYLALRWDDIIDFENEVLSDIERTDSAYYHGMLDVIRWMKVKDVYKQNITENGTENL